MKCSAYAALGPAAKLKTSADNAESEPYLRSS